MDNTKYSLELFGQNFTLTTSDGKKEDLHKIAGYYKRVVEELIKKFPSSSHLNISVLAGLMITDDLYNLSKEKKSPLKVDDKKIDETINELLKQLEVSLSL